MTEPEANLPVGIPRIHFWEAVKARRRRIGAGNASMPTADVTRPRE